MRASLGIHARRSLLPLTSEVLYIAATKRNSGPNVKYSDVTALVYGVDEDADGFIELLRSDWTHFVSRSITASARVRVSPNAAPPMHFIITALKSTIELSSIRLTMKSPPVTRYDEWRLIYFSHASASVGLSRPPISAQRKRLPFNQRYRRI